MSMTDPTILQLLEKADCRYTLVVETSKRARQLIEQMQAALAENELSEDDLARLAEEQAEQEPAAPELAALCGTQRTATRLVQQQAEDLGCERPAPRHPRLFAITRHQSHCENKARHEPVKTQQREKHNKK